MRARHGRLLEQLRRVGGTAAPDAPGSESALPASPAAEASPKGRTSQARNLRVDVATLDRILDLTGEMAVARGRLAQALASPQGHEHALEVHREAERLQADLQELVMKVRMVPLGPTLARVARVLRDAAAPLGKSARLRLEGEDVEVDTKVAELIADPLTHLARNAVAHGLERPEVRTAAGKDPCGTVTVTAARETGSIVITVADDGAGLDRARILESARRRGLAVADDPQQLDDMELQRLIFEPGFSTAEAVSELAGRGVGLDVVRRNVESLRGTLSLASTAGRGATFTIRLPLTLAIIPGFAVAVGEETFLVPLESVVSCMDLPPGGDGRRDTGVLDLRGEVIPFVRLRQRFGFGGERARERVVIVQHRGRQVGLVADALLGDQQAVIKPLGRLFRSVPGVSGSSVLGDGKVALLLDVAAVVDEAAAPEPTAEQVL